MIKNFYKIYIKNIVSKISLAYLYNLFKLGVMFAISMMFNYAVKGEIENIFPIVGKCMVVVIVVCTLKYVLETKLSIWSKKNREEFKFSLYEKSYRDYRVSWETYKSHLNETLNGFSSIKLNNLYSLFYKFRISSKRYMEWTTCDEENGNGKINSLYPINLNNLKYSYDKKSYALNGLSFSINEGNHFVLRGSNGCRKSTLINILNGIYDDYEGEVTLNNIPLSEIDKGTLRNQISYLEQNYLR